MTTQSSPEKGTIEKRFDEQFEIIQDGAVIAKIDDDGLPTKSYILSFIRSEVEAAKKECENRILQWELAYGLLMDHAKMYKPEDHGDLTAYMDSLKALAEEK